MTQKETHQEISKKDLDEWKERREEEKKQEAFWQKVALIPARPLIDILRKDTNDES